MANARNDKAGSRFTKRRRLRRGRENSVVRSPFESVLPSMRLNRKEKHVATVCEIDRRHFQTDTCLGHFRTEITPLALALTVGIAREE